MKVLVIGGTGVISTAIVERLIMLKHKVTVFNRGVHAVRFDCTDENIELIRGDKKNSSEFGELGKRDFDAVIDMISYNPDDAAATVDTFTKSPNRVPHMVFTSTVATYKRPYRGIPLTEAAEQFDTDISPYGFWKAKMEACLKGRIAEGVPITIIRPSLTYGIGSKNVGVMRNNYGIVKRLQAGKPLIVFGDGTNPWEWTFAPDLAKAFTGVLEHKECIGQVYHMTSGEHHIWDDLYLAFGKIVGVEPKLLHISTEMMMYTAPTVFQHIYDEKMHCGIFDNSKIKRHVPEIKIEYGLDRIVQELCSWYDRDESARIIDNDLDLLEDRLVDKYYRCKEIMEE